MFANKIKLTDAYLDLIIQKRKEHNLTAYQLSEHIGKNKSWLPNIENHRTKNITKEDFFLIFQDFAKEENMDTEAYIIKYLSPDALVELEDNTFIPCSHLKIELNLLLPETQIKEPLLLPEISPPRLDSQPEQLIQLTQSLSNLNKIIEHAFFTMPDQEKQHTLDMLLTMIQNFSCHFPITRSLYEIPIFEEPYNNPQHLNHSSPENNSDKDNDWNNKRFHEEELSNLIKNFSDSISFLNAKAKIYRFIDTSFSSKTLFYKIKNYHYGNLQELTEILFDIETYIHAIYDYVNLSYKNPEIHNDETSLDYQELYRIMLIFINDFLCIAEITYPFDFELPDTEPTKEELEKKHLEITNIIFQIRKLFYNKYNNHYPTNTEFSSNKIKEQKEIKSKKAKEQKYLKFQKMQKFQKETKKDKNIIKNKT